MVLPKYKFKIMREQFPEILKIKDIAGLNI
jgi:hypothetical protein